MTHEPAASGGPRAIRILALDGIHERGVQIMKQTPGVSVDVRDKITPADLLSIIGEYDAVVVRSATKVTAEVIAKGTPRLKVVGRAGIGVDNIDVKAASKHGVLVMNTPTGNAVTTAEHAISLLCALARHVPQATASVKAGKWEKKKFEGRELCDKFLGIIGLGNIGRIVADRARGLHMRVIAYDPFITPDAAARLGIELCTLDELFRRADFITVHTPLTDETRGIVGADAFRKMKKGVLIVNAARGGVVDEAALAQAIQEGIVAGAALDVFVKEPPDGENPLLKLDQVICTPHLGASTEEAQEKVAVEIAEQFIAFFQGGEIRNAVNAPSINREVAPRVQPYLDLAYKLGSLLGQLTGGAPVGELHVELTGDPAELAPRAVTDSAVAGVLQPFLAVPVNRINARPLAKDRELAITETQRTRGGDFANAVTLTVRGPGHAQTVSGTVFSVGQGEPRIVRYGEFLLEVVPDGHILILRNKDVPGVIGAVGRLLGQHEVNVSRMQVGLWQGEALSMWNISRPLTDAVLGELRALPQLVSAYQVSL